MSFDNPAALWLLALAAPIVFAHLVRGRLRPVQVPSLLFWDRAMVEEARVFGIRQVRRYASLALNLAALVLLVSMLAGPSVRGWTHEPEEVAFVLDTTLDMAAGERMDGAREYVRRSLDSLHRTDLAALYDSAGLLVPHTTDRRRVLRALEGEPRWRRRAVDAAAHLNGRVKLVSGGEPVENVAITGSRLRGKEAVIRLAGSGPVLLIVEGDFERTGGVRAEAPGEPVVPLPDAELVRIAKAPADAQPVDDGAFFVVPPPAPPPVLVLSEGDADPFLLRALELLSQRGEVGTVGTAEAASYPEIRGVIDETTLVIADGGTIESPGRGTFVCFGTRSPAWVAAGETEAVWVVDWDRAHPALESVNLSALAIRRARTFSAGTPFVRATAGPIGVRGGGPGRAWIVFGFRLEETDLRLSASFPLLLRNIARWARAGATRTFDRAVESGGDLVNRLPLVPAEGTASIEWTDGASSSTETVAYRGGMLRHTLVRPGFYRVRAGAREEWVAVPHAPPEGADLSASEPLPDPPAPLPWYRDVPYVWAAGVLLLLLLVAEWILYQKRLI
ncbi:MAG: BatA domain-containing protein [Planctomycetota bacterium]